MSDKAANTLSRISGRVLVVDDEPAVGELLVEALADTGVEVVVAGSVAEAASVAEKAPPDLLVVDLTLGDGDGVELVDRLRRRWADLPALIITGHRDAETLSVASRLRPVEILTKPLDLERLRRAIAEELNRRRRDARRQRLRRLANTSVRRRQGTLQKLSAACSELTTTCRDLQRQLDRQEAMIQYQHELLACANEDDIFRRFFRMFVAQSGAVFGAALLCDSEARLKLVGRFGVPVPDGANFCRALADSVVDEVLTRPRVFTLDAMQQQHLFAPSVRRYLVGMTLMVVPLMIGEGRLIGLVVLYRKGEQPFTDEDAALAGMMAPATGAAAQKV